MTARPAALAAVRLLAAPAATQTFTWSGLNNTTWNTTSSNWNGLGTWSNGSASDAVFDIDFRQTTTLGENITANNLSFAVNGYSIAGGGFSLSLAGTGSGIDVASGVSASLGMTVSGSVGLTKTGTGSLTLTGASDYTGGTTISAGTLRIGGGGTTGSILGNVTNNAALVFDRSDFFSTFGGNISGTGSVAKEGAGFVVLTGTNTYSGGTTISGGTLQIGDGNATGSITGNVTNNASLVFARSDSTTFAGDISGSGLVAKGGVGVLTLSGTNNYTGGTQVQGGTLFLTGTNTGTGGVSVFSGATLQLGDGTINGTFGGNINSDGAVVFNPGTGGLTYGGSIAQVGTVSKLGANTLTLSGANTYTGATSVFAGTLILTGTNTGTGGVSVFFGATLQLGDGTNTGTFGGNINSDGAVVFNPGAAGLTFGGVIAQVGSVTKTGAGTLTLTGTNTYTGATTVSAGTLRVNGSLAAGSAVAVNGGSLGGTGTVNGTVAVNNGGSVAPGASIGKLTAGSTTFAGGGGYAFEYNPATSSPTAGTDNDLLKGLASATLTLNNTSGNKFNLVVTTIGGSPVGGTVTYRFAEYDTISGVGPGDVTDRFNVTGDFYGTPVVTLVDGGMSADFLTVQFTPAPEPGLVLGLAATGLGLVRVGRQAWGRGPETRSGRRG